jgi:hypothetical protein
LWLVHYISPTIPIHVVADDLNRTTLTQQMISVSYEDGSHPSLLQSRWIVAAYAAAAQFQPRQR